MQAYIIIITSTKEVLLGKCQMKQNAFHDTRMGLVCVTRVSYTFLVNGNAFPRHKAVLVCLTFSKLSLKSYERILMKLFKKF